jgi:hypothetical protein
LYTIEFAVVPSQFLHLLPYTADVCTNLRWYQSGFAEEQIVTSIVVCWYQSCSHAISPPAVVNPMDQSLQQWACQYSMSPSMQFNYPISMVLTATSRLYMDLGYTFTFGQVRRC